MPSQAKLFFDRHLEYLAQNDLEGMVNDSYHSDAILYNAFPIYAGLPPWNIARGRGDILTLFKDYLDFQGVINVEKVYNYFEAVINSPNSGRWAAGDIWFMDADFKMILRHYGFAHKL